MKKKSEQVRRYPWRETATASSAKTPAPSRAPFRPSGRIEQKPRATVVVVKKKKTPLRVSANAAGTNPDNLITDGRGVSAAVRVPLTLSLPDRHGFVPTGPPCRTPGRRPAV